MKRTQQSEGGGGGARAAAAPLLASPAATRALARPHAPCRPLTPAGSSILGSAPARCAACSAAPSASFQFVEEGRLQKQAEIGRLRCACIAHAGLGLVGPGVAERGSQGARLLS